MEPIRRRRRVRHPVEPDEGDAGRGHHRPGEFGSAGPGPDPAASAATDPTTTNKTTTEPTTTDPTPTDPTTTEPPRPAPPPGRTRPGPASPGAPDGGWAADSGDAGDSGYASYAERGLRGLVGSGSSQVTPAAAMRARDAARPRPEDVATAETSLVVIRRHWTPRDGTGPPT